MTTRQREEEIRCWRTELETRSSGTLRRIGGIGVPYEKRSRLLPGGFYEIVEKRALAKTLADRSNIVSRLEHHPEWLLGTTDSGTMRVKGMPEGVDFEVDLPQTTAGNDTYELHKRGDLRYASMGFQSFEGEFRREGSVVVRHLISIRLQEISPTATPAYWDTASALRSLSSQVGEDPEDIERLAAQGELRSLFPPRQPVHIDMAPTPLDVVEARSAEPSSDGGLDIRRRLLALYKRKMDAELTPRQRAMQEYRRTTADLTTRQARLRLSQTRIDEIEARSLGRGEPWDVRPV
jgi:uncharacterized protein